MLDKRKKEMALASRDGEAAKCTFQKLYEKKRMVELRPESLHIMVGRDRELAREPGLYLCVGHTPVAKLLSQAELDETIPDFDASEKIQMLLTRMQEIDPRDADSDFDLPVGDGFEERFFGLTTEIDG